MVEHRTVDYAAYAGTVYFPRDPRDLTDQSQCPACFATLGTLVCPACGLDLNHPAAGELAALSATAAEQLDQRLLLIGRIRYETAQRLAERQATAAPDAVAADAVRGQGAAAAAFPAPAAHTAADQPGPVAQTAVGAGHDAERPSATSPAQLANTADADGPEPAAEATPAVGSRSRSGVQVLLLVVGVALLSVAAIFFTLVALITFGLVGRTVIVAAVTLASIAAASVLKRRRLIATGEGIAVFAAILVLLDIWAIRANDLFGTAAADGLIYWGVALLIASTAFVAWHRVSALRTPSVVASALLPFATAMLTAGTATGFDEVTRTFAAFTAAAIPALALPAIQVRRAGGPPVPATPERIVVVAAAFGGLTLALFTGFFVDPFSTGPLSDWSPAIALCILAATAAAVAAVAARADESKIVRIAAGPVAAVGGVAAASACAATAFRVDSPGFGIFAPTLAAAVVALLADAARMRADRRRMPLAVAAIAAAIVAGLIATYPVARLVLGVATVIDRSLANAWSFAATETIAEPDDVHGLAALALALAVAIAAGVWTIAGRLASHRALLAWSAAVVLVLSVPLLQTPLAIAAGWLVLALGAIATLVVGRARPRPTSLAFAIALAAVALVFGYSTGWASTQTWWAASAGAVVVLSLGRVAVARTAAASPVEASGTDDGTSAESRHAEQHGGTRLRAALLALAVIVALVAAAATPQHLLFADPPGLEISVLGSLRFVALASAAFVLVAALPLMRVLAEADRRTLFWITAPVAALSNLVAGLLLGDTTADARADLVLPEFQASLGSGAILLASLVLWIALPQNRAHRAERVSAGVLLAPAVYLMLDSLARVLDFDELAIRAAPLAAAVVVTAAALALGLRRAGTPTRSAAEIGALALALPALAHAIAWPTDASWIMLILAAVAALPSAVSADGLFASASPRRHAGWAALALAIAGVWWRLAENGTELVEAYVLPLGGALLIVAALAARGERRRGRPGPAPAFIVLGGLTVAILPLAVTATTGSAVRAVVVLGASAVLALAGSWIPGTRDAQQYLDVATAAGLAGVLVTGFGHAAVDTFDGPAWSLQPDAWAAAAAAITVIVAFGLAGAGRGERGRNESGSGEAGGPPDDRPHLRLRSQLASAVAITGLVALLIVELPALDSTRFGPLRALALVLLFCLIHVTSFAVRRAPLGLALSWVALGAAALAGTVGVATGSLDPLEFASVPIALALLVSGELDQARRPQARSWALLGPGTVVLLVPSLVATVEDRPMWRLVGIGVVGVAVIVVGLIRRLQAPFLIGIGVTLVHAIATFAPQIRAAYESVPWWLWLGVGGLLLIVLAARYERRIRNLKSIALHVAAMR